MRTSRAAPRAEEVSGRFNSEARETFRTHVLLSACWVSGCLGNLLERESAQYSERLFDPIWISPNARVWHFGNQKFAVEEMEETQNREQTWLRGARGHLRTQILGVRAELPRNEAGRGEPSARCWGRSHAQ